MAEITYQMVLSTLQTAGILVGIFYYVMSLRNQQKNQELTLKAQDLAIETRKAQMAQVLIGKLSTREFYPAWMDIVYQQPFENYDDWLEKYGPRTNMPAYINFCFIMEQYDMAGFALRHELVDAEYIYTRIGDTAIRVWDIVEPIINGLRAGSPSGRGRYYSLWENFELMANEHKKIRERLYDLNLNR